MRRRIPAKDTYLLEYRKIISDVVETIYPSGTRKNCFEIESKKGPLQCVLWNKTCATKGDVISLRGIIKNDICIVNSINIMEHASSDIQK